MALRAALLLLLCGVFAAAVGARSCTGQGQVHVPCEDRLALEPTEKFLLTLAGHGCYDIVLRAATPLSVAFYEAQGSLYAWRLREMQALDSDLELLSGDVAPVLAETVAALAGATDSASAQVAEDGVINATAATTVSAAAVAASAHLCDNSLNCHRVVRGLSRGGVYNLVVAFEHSETGEATAGGDKDIFVRLESCDAASLSHIVALLVVTSMGFASAMLCLCLLSEYVLGLRSLTKFKRSLQRPHVFVELAQVDSSSPSSSVAAKASYGGSEGVGTSEQEDSGEDDAANDKLLGAAA